MHTDNSSSSCRQGKQQTKNIRLGVPAIEVNRTDIQEGGATQASHCQNFIATSWGHEMDQVHQCAFAASVKPCHTAFFLQGVDAALTLTGQQHAASYPAGVHAYTPRSFQDVRRARLCLSTTAFSSFCFPCHSIAYLPGSCVTQSA
jgi:hypothetical protein